MGDVSQANPLAILVELEQRIRSISEINELKFVFVNQTQSLVPYRQAILFAADGKPTTFSGVATMEQGAPFVHWLKKHIAPVIKNTNFEKIKLKFSYRAASGRRKKVIG